MNKKIKIMLVFTLVLSINFSIFAEETGEKDEINEVVQKDILEEDDGQPALEVEDSKDLISESKEDVEEKTHETEETLETSKQMDKDVPQVHEIEDHEETYKKMDKDVTQDNKIEDHEETSKSSEEIGSKPHEGVVSVKTWEEYVMAYNDESVQEIKIEKDIVANKTFPINRRVSSLLIDGNNFIFDAKELGETLFQLDMEESLEKREVVFKNIKLLHNESAIIETGEEDGGANPVHPSEKANWSITFNNFSSQDATPQYIVSGLGIDAIHVIGLFDGKASAGAFKNHSQLLFKDADVFIKNGIVGEDIQMINSKLESDSPYGIFLSMNSIEIEKSELNLTSRSNFAFSTINPDSSVKLKDVSLTMENISELSQGFNSVEIEDSQIALKSSNFLDGVKDVKISNTKIKQEGGIVFSNLENAQIQADINVTNGSYLIKGGKNIRFIDSVIEYDGPSEIIDSQNVTFEGTELISDIYNTIYPIKTSGVFELIKESKLYLKNRQYGLDVNALLVDNSILDVEVERKPILSDRVTFKNGARINLLVSNGRSSNAGIKMTQGYLDMEDSYLKIISEREGIADAKKLNIVNSEIIIESKVKSIQTQSMHLEDTILEARSEGDEVVYIGGENFKEGVSLVMTGEQTNVLIESMGSGGPNTGALAIRTYDSVPANNSGVLISEGAKVKVETPEGAQGFYSRVYQGKTKVDGKGTEFSVRSERKSSSYPVIRYRVVGFQTFEASNYAKVNFQAEGRAHPVVRMYGDGNRFIVKSHASVKIHNKGDGRARNPGASASNQGLFFTTGTSIPSEFRLEDEGSSMEIIADYGAAIDGRTNELLINVGDGTTFIADGKTSSRRGIFYADTVNFITNSPKYYDFRNRIEGGGPVIDADSSAYYESNVSDLAVWERGDDLEGNPYKTWSQFSFKLSGRNLENILESDYPDFNDGEESFGKNGMSNYTRISGNNAKPEIDFVRENPYDTDRYIYGHAVVPEGVSGIRNAWTDEVYVSLRETLPNGEVNEYRDLPTVGMENNNTGYPVYDTEESERAGYFRLDLGEGQLAEIGSKYEVISAYRGEKDLPDKRKIYADGPFPNEVVVTDKTPPKTSQVSTPIFNGQTKILGLSEEKEVSVFLAINGEILRDDQGNEVTTKSNKKGEWEIDLSGFDDLEIGDEVQILLEDREGNRNPKVDTPFHDIVKKAGTIVTVEESRFTLNAKETFMTLKDFSKDVKTDKDLMDRMEVEAYEEGAETIEHEALVLKRDDLEYENPQAGSYAITFVIDGHDTIMKEEKIHILPYDHLGQTDEYLIVANDFYDGNEAYLEEDAYFIEKANAKAWSKEDLSQELIVSLKKNTLSGDAGDYPMEFYLPDEGIDVGITATILDRKHVVETKDFVIAANDFKIMEYEAVDINRKEIIDYSQAYGIEKTSREKVAVEVLKHNVIAEVGEYSATLIIK